MKSKIKIIAFLVVIIGIVGMLVITKIYMENNLVSPEEVTTDEKYVDISYKDDEELKNIENEDIIGYLSIEKIDLRAKVKSGSDKETLKNYIGIIGTNIYDGNVCFAAHNRGYENSFFARINELELNDQIVYETNFFKRVYKVTDIKVIKDTDLSVLDNCQNNKLTLITCVKNRSTQRLCVQAEEIL